MFYFVSDFEDESSKNPIYEKIFSLEENLEIISNFEPSTIKILNRNSNDHPSYLLNTKDLDYKKPTLRSELYIDNLENISQSELGQIFEKISSNSNIKKLIFTPLNISSSSYYQLAEFIRKDTIEILELNLPETIEKDLLLNLIDSLKYSENLHTLEIFYKNKHINLIDFLREVLQVNKNLGVLRIINSTNIEEKDFIDLTINNIFNLSLTSFSRDSKNIKLTFTSSGIMKTLSLNIESNAISNQIINLLLQKLPTSLISLSLNSYPLNLIDLSQIFKDLKNTQIAKLELEQCGINDQNACLLFQNLPITLHTLSLDNNPIGNEGDFHNQLNIILPKTKIISLTLRNTGIFTPIGNEVLDKKYFMFTNVIENECKLLLNLRIEGLIQDQRRDPQRIYWTTERDRKNDFKTFFTNVKKVFSSIYGVTNNRIKIEEILNLLSDSYFNRRMEILLNNGYDGLLSNIEKVGIQVHKKQLLNLIYPKTIFNLFSLIKRVNNNDKEDNIDQLLISNSNPWELIQNHLPKLTNLSSELKR